MMHASLIYGAMLSVALIASVTDLRTGLIPNWLTFPVLLAAPLLEGVFGGLRGFVGALLGILVCGVVPAIFHRLDAMGGGDVKLFAALGGLGGPMIGLEIELLALSCAFVWGLGMLVYQGRLYKALGTSGQLLANTFLPAKRQKRIEPEQLTSLRIGAAIFAGTLLAVLDHTWLGGLLS